MEPAAAILAGGRSKRFGQDKRFFEIEGKSLIQITFEKIQKIFEKIYIICDNKTELRRKFPYIGPVFLEDIVKYHGPLMGIFSFFKLTSEEKGLFFPVDMPFLTIEFILFLRKLAERGEYHIITIENKPLPIYVSRKVFPLIEKYIGDGGHSIKGLIQIASGKYRVYIVDKKSLKLFGSPSRYMKNINSPRDLKNIDRKLYIP